MKLKRLIDSIDSIRVKGSKEVEISGLCAHSQLTSPGNLFIAKRGQTHDGAKFIREAVAAGAAAVLTDLYDPFLPAVQLIHSDVASVEGLLASRYYGQPSHRLKVVGITGTNGKTTTSYLIHHMLEKMGVRAGLIGTIEWIVGAQRFAASSTTPDVITCHKLLKEMEMAGCKAAVMEVSSHGLAQQRVAQIAFDVAAFTNLSPEHLDYHGTMEEYKKAKGILFEGLCPQSHALFNADDPTCFATVAKTLNYGINSPADLRATQISLSEKGLSYRVSYQAEQVEVKSKLIGRFNVANSLAAIGACLSLGFSLAECAQALRDFPGVKGRLQRVPNSLRRTLIVDYAHTPDALSNALQTLREVTRGRVIVVFGAGGDRDRKKRPLMGEMAEAYSDVAIITTDNPRSEDPERIAEEVAQGFRKAQPLIELDRRRAIAKAVDLSKTGDAILIAGKGHETGQLFGHQITPFDDIEVARAVCRESERACS